jgi:1-deoxy-D-xylulose-5-phosphate synthase
MIGIGPDELKRMDSAALKKLAGELRGRSSAHAAPAAGTWHPASARSSLIIALHAALDLEKDSLVFDVGHQSYAHNC